MAPALALVVTFVALYWTAATTLLGDWWRASESDLGLLLGPLAIYLAYRSGFAPRTRPQPWLGTALLCCAVLLRFFAEVAVDRYTLRLSMIGGLVALVVFFWGVRQILRWWLPVILLVLVIPLPNDLWAALALPLQLLSAKLGASLLAWRHLPVQLVGTVIHLPGHSLLVTEGCSGLRSMFSIVILALIAGKLWLRSPWNKGLVVASVLPVALLLNGVRIFITGFLVFFVDPALGRGALHVALGWVMFVVNFAVMGAVVWVLAHLEHWSARWRTAQ